MSSQTCRHQTFGNVLSSKLFQHDEEIARFGARFSSIKCLVRLGKVSFVRLGYSKVSPGNTVKIKPRFGECYTCFGCETETGVVRMLVIFQDRVCSAISFKRSRRELPIDVAEHTSTLKSLPQYALPPF